ncbi:MAG TPA: diaminopimelate epimerase [Chloroflexota bacterium]|nr:diaminopimelate epimerase [Chloroflexota bacterium]
MARDRVPGEGHTNILKMHGAGNDFVLVDGREGRQANWAELARQLCDRHFGIGADGLLLRLPSASADARMEVWNPDGTRAEMCGNGVRCFARWVLDQEPAARAELSVETGAGILRVAAEDGGALRASMGTPHLAGPDIPVHSDRNPVLDLALPGLDFAVTCVSMGNPHAVRFVDDVYDVDLAALGPLVEHHPLFPHRTNFHLCQVLSRGALKVRHWERGAGLTLACGTGAAATAVAARLHGLIDDEVALNVPGGQLRVSWNGAGEVYLAGPADYVFAGTWPAPDRRPHETASG